MIYGKSHDAILIKKITLHVWPLRQEVEQRIQEQLLQGLDKEAIIKSLQSASFVVSEIPAAEETKAEEAKTEEAKTEEAKTEEAKTEEAKTEEAKPEEAKAEEAKTEEAKTEETKAEEAKTEEAKTEEAKTEEAKAEEAKPEEAKSEADPASTSPSAATSPATPEAAAETTPDKAPAEAEESPAPNYYQGTMVLQEINMRDMCFFCESSFLEGQEVLVEFQIPTKFKILGTVHYARRYAFRSHIIGRQNLPYRVYLTFNFAQESEKIPLRNFLQHISSLNHKEKPMPIKAS